MELASLIAACIFTLSCVETEHGCVVSEMATAYGNSKQIGRYAIAAAMNEVLTRAERVDQMEIRVCAPLEEKKKHLYPVLRLLLSQPLPHCCSLS